MLVISELRFVVYKYLRAALLLLICFCFCCQGKSIPLTSSFSPIKIRIYCSQNPIPAESLWLSRISSDKHGAKSLSKFIKEWETIRVSETVSREDWQPHGALMRAAEDGIRCLPTILLVDKKNRVFARIEGGANKDNLEAKLALLHYFIINPRPVSCINRIKTGSAQTQSKLICSYLSHVPVERWFVDYPRTMKRLEKLQSQDKAFILAKDARLRLAKVKQTAQLIQQSFDARQPEEIWHCIELWRQKIDDPCTSLEDKQRFLLAFVHPLWIRLEAFHYQGGHVPASEEAFSQAIQSLEEARDIDKSSPLGKRADYLREELRKARLSAAKYD